MKSALVLTIALGVLGAATANAAVSAGPAGWRLPAAGVAGASTRSDHMLRLARNGADDPAGHDADEHLLDDLLATPHHRHGRGQGADDGATGDADDDHESQGNSGSGKSGSGNSGSGSSGSGNSGSGGSGSGGSGSGGSGSGKSG